MTEDFGHRQLVVDLFAIAVAALLVVGAVLLIGPVALLIGALWMAVGAALALLIGPAFGSSPENYQAIVEEE